MRILGWEIVDRFSHKHADVRGALRAWYADVTLAKWQTPLDVKARYQSADILSDNCVVFNIKGNKYRLITKIRYEIGIVRVCFIGTHEEYNRIDAQSVC